jgi:hypothetical protein
VDPQKTIVTSHQHSAIREHTSGKSGIEPGANFRLPYLCWNEPDPFRSRTLPPAGTVRDRPKIIGFFHGFEAGIPVGFDKQPYPSLTA